MSASPHHATSLNALYTATLSAFTILPRKASRELTTQRTEERAGQVASALKEARIASDTAYNNLTRRVNALWVVEYDEAYDEFINFVNELIKHYKQEVLTKRKSNKTTDETSDEPTEE